MPTGRGPSPTAICPGSEAGVRNFSGVRRVVVKLGTNVLTSGDALDRDFVFDVAS